MPNPKFFENPVEIDERKKEDSFPAKVVSENVVVADSLLGINSDVSKDPEVRTLVSSKKKSKSVQVKGRGNYRIVISNNNLRSILKREVVNSDCPSIESYLFMAILYYLKHARKKYYELYVDNGLIKE